VFGGEIGTMRGGWIIPIAIYVVLFLVYVFFFGRQVEPGDWMQIMLLVALVSVTVFYAGATHRQAVATVRTVELMKEQMSISSRPLIIQKPECKLKAGFPNIDIDRRELRSDYFSHFVVMNVGNGPAIEVEVSLMDKEKNRLHSIRETFLRAGEQRDFEDFHADLVNREESTYYLVCEYKRVFPPTSGLNWDQTWLPFRLVKSSKEGEIYVAPGELSLCEVQEKDRIDAFGSRSKPQ